MRFLVNNATGSTAGMPYFLLAANPMQTLVVQPFFDASNCLFLQFIFPQLPNENAVATASKVLQKLRHITYAALLPSISPVISPWKAVKLVMCDLPLVNHMLAVPDFLLVLHAFRNGFQEDALHKSRDWFLCSKLVMNMSVEQSFSKLMSYIENLGPIIVLAYIILLVIN